MARDGKTAAAGRDMATRMHRHDPPESPRATSARRVRPVLLSGVLFLATMCSGGPESRQVAGRFMELYYGESRVADAVKLCTGAAKAKLEAELVAMRGMAPAAAPDKPRITFRLTSENVAGAAQATYVYDVDPRTSDVGPLTATLGLTADGGEWLVSALGEKTSGS